MNIYLIKIKMENELQTSIDILKEQKNKLPNQIKKNNEENKYQLLQNLNDLDNLLENYYIKLSKSKIYKY